MVDYKDVRDTQIIVDLGKIEKNMKLICDLVGSDVAVMPVTKPTATATAQWELLLL